MENQVITSSSDFATWATLFWHAAAGTVSYILSKGLFLTPVQNAKVSSKNILFS
jgi:hypothetical protein